MSQTQRSPALGDVVSDGLDCQLDLRIIWTIRNVSIFTLYSIPSPLLEPNREISCSQPELLLSIVLFSELKMVGPHTENLYRVAITLFDHSKGFGRIQRLIDKNVCYFNYVPFHNQI